MSICLHKNHTIDGKNNRKTHFFQKNRPNNLVNSKKCRNFALAIKRWSPSSVVEQWTENPCVPGSIPGGTTRKR